MTDHLTDLYARDYEDSIIEEVKNNPMWKVGMRVLIFGEYTGVITKHLGFQKKHMQHAYAAETDHDGFASCVFESELQRITERKLVLVKS